MTSVHGLPLFLPSSQVMLLVRSGMVAGAAAVAAEAIEAEASRVAQNAMIFIQLVGISFAGWCA